MRLIRRFSRAELDGWSSLHDAAIRRRWGTMPTVDLARALGRTSYQVAGRARTLGLVKPLDWPARHLALVRRHYDGSPACLDALVGVTGKCRHQVRHLARRLGLAAPRTPDWTPDDEARLTVLWGRHPDAVVARMLGRTVTACALKAKRLHRARRDGAYGWNYRELGRWFGVDAHAVARWVRLGWLSAMPAPYRVGRNHPMIVGEPSLVAFLTERPEEYDLARFHDPSGYYRRLAEAARRADPLLTVAQAATALGVVPETVRRHIGRGWLPAVKGHTNGNAGVWWVRRGALAAFRSRNPDSIGNTRRRDAERRKRGAA